MCTLCIISICPWTSMPAAACLLYSTYRPNTTTYVLLFIHQLMMMTIPVINWLGMSTCCLQLWIFFEFICMWFQLHDSFHQPQLLLRSDLTIWLDQKQDFPSFNKNFQVFQWHLQAIFELHVGSTYWVFPYKQFTIQQPLWEMLIAHPAHLTSPLLSKVCMLGIPMHDKTSMLGIFSCHLILSSLQRHDMWN